MIKPLLALISLFFVFSPFVGFAQEADNAVEIFLEKEGAITSKSEWHITSEHISSTSKIHHIYFQQIKGGVLINGTESSIHLSPKGDIVAENYHFIQNVSEIKSIPKSNLINPKEAIRVVVGQMSYRPTSDFSFRPEVKETLNEVVFSDGGISPRDISVRLFYTLDDNQKYRLVWEVSILELDYLRWMNIEVDALTGAIINSENIMQSCATTNDDFVEEVIDFNRNLILPSIENTLEDSENLCEVCYEVFAMPLVSPLAGERTIVQNPADPIASPFGWHDTNGQTGSETTVTDGNNTRVVESGNHIGYLTSGGQRLDFTGFEFSPIFTEENQYEDAALTNVFYWINIIHDVTYHFGFDELSGSFQKINYLSGGRRNSDFEARTQSRSGCNAFFASNGGRPIMILSSCEDKDAAFDAIVIIHEYGHGIVKQLIGGGSIGCLPNEEQMTEGWADYLGIMLTMNSSDMAEDRRTIGNYFFGQGIKGRGIRRYPYSVDFSINPQTYDFIKTSSVPHGVGSVWTTMLWEMTWALVDEYGFDSNLYSFTGDVNKDAGNVMALALVLEGMKLMRCSPGFIDARDAILQANIAIYGIENQCVVFNAFARRGLGLYADQGEPRLKDDGVQDFTEYPVTAQILEISPICYQEGIINGLKGGLPLGGVYSGIGVIDDGNGETFSVDTSISGTGSLLLTYEVGDSFCSMSSTSEREISIDFDKTPPLVECPGNIEDTVVFDGTYILPDYRTSVIVTDYCSDKFVVVQEPASFTELSDGEHSIKMIVTDEAGNTTECVFLLNVKLVGSVNLDFLSTVLLYPIPASGEVIIYNPSEKRILSIYIRDINGRIIKSISPRSKELNVPIQIDQLSAGNYFITIVGERDTVVKRMTKI